MPTLEIEGKQYQARCDFKFERTAEEKYNEKDESGNKQGGLRNVYLGLLEQRSSLYLIRFWDCALSHLKDKKPSVEKIEAALEEVVDKEGAKGAERLYKEAFQAVDQSGFFAVQVKRIWQDFDVLKKEIKQRVGETEAEFLKRKQEREDAKEMMAELEKLRKEMNK
ncbi:tail assembly chaperone [Bacillus paralicheniformis]|uniref:tail assembly chaperone n=1 Tax=Bacillus TaxID=1386 RepID=UPI000949745B|nr:MULTISPECIES: tail assembly chaperone [Bacillus subtilis group]MEB3127540.1 tail assembly chaperone [Bacillus paralicheniformis]MEC2293162.1 tail assembly chaperone [Bacillus licheniformis]MEC5234355.1 tail assembly chaperone [Bacillus licheniformis]MEC5250012.1 tail assembly chaperone [Bacillus licheniformis]MED1234759.1 tail assembly chaperone [Bacillus paralicheniformis]